MNQAHYPRHEQLLMDGKLLELKEFAIWICMSSFSFWQSSCFCWLLLSAFSSAKHFEMCCQRVLLKIGWYVCVSLSWMNEGQLRWKLDWMLNMFIHTATCLGERNKKKLRTHRKIVAFERKLVSCASTLFQVDSRAWLDNADRKIIQLFSAVARLNIYKRSRKLIHTISDNVSSKSFNVKNCN